MVIRNREKIDSDLTTPDGKHKAICDGFVPVPITNFIQKKPFIPWQNDIFRTTCHYADVINNARWEDDRAYKKAMWLKDTMKEKYGAFFDLN